MRGAWGRRARTLHAFGAPRPPPRPGRPALRRTTPLATSGHADVVGPVAAAPPPAHPGTCGENTPVTAIPAETPGSRPSGPSHRHRPTGTGGQLTHEVSTPGEGKRANLRHVRPSEPRRHPASPAAGPNTRSTHRPDEPPGLRVRASADPHPAC
ncbi:hypothetical protein JNUCC0626_49735 (plasmid) [Lentzea sp. JNUCC 0626]|uniref:hypothetical protein n=1 Tax=Lentzea sp. JNUCC 0626 TaxID=3367513 RepID=UPI00374A7F4A